MFKSFAVFPVFITMNCFSGVLQTRTLTLFCVSLFLQGVIIDVYLLCFRPLQSLFYLMSNCSVFGLQEPLLVDFVFFTCSLVGEFFPDSSGTIPTLTQIQPFLQGCLVPYSGGTRVAHCHWVGHRFLSFSVHGASDYILYFMRLCIISLHPGLLLYPVIGNHFYQLWF